MPGKGAGTGPDMRRAAAVLLLVVVAAIGLRAGGAFSASAPAGLLTTSGKVLYWGLEAVAGALALAGVAILVARLIWGRGSGRKRPPHQPRTPWWVLLLPLLAVTLSRLVAYLKRHSAQAAHGRRPAPGGSHRAATASHLLPSGSAWPLLISVALLAAVAAVLLVSSRQRPYQSPPRDQATDEPPLLAAAVAAGTEALHRDTDPRTAIVNCYAAMERALAEAGSPPLAADTPAEVLDRAAAGGLALPAAAATLTGLFREARYGTRPMTEEDRAAALGALAALRASLEVTA
jgi:Domain of unknown function (DUF4129)